MSNDPGLSYMREGRAVRVRAARAQAAWRGIGERDGAWESVQEVRGVRCAI